LLNGFVLLSLGLNLTEADWTPAALWLAVVASGLYHGVNPGMGWPLAVSAGLIERSSHDDVIPDDDEPAVSDAAE
jgi:hypothetical protein